MIDKIALYIGYFWINLFFLGSFQAAVLNRYLDDLTINERVVTGILAIFLTIGFANREIIYDKIISLDYSNLSTYIKTKYFSIKNNTLLDLPYKKKRKDLSFLYEKSNKLEIKEDSPFIHLDYLFNIHSKYNNLFPNFKHDEISILFIQINTQLQLEYKLNLFLINFSDLLF